MSYFLYLNNAAIGYEKPIISNISTSLELGEVCLLMGNNGIGKTTLIKTILGQNKILEGEIFINKKSIPKLNPKEIAEQVAVVFSKAEIPNNYTVTDLVSLGKYIHYPYYFKLNEKDRNEVKYIINQLNLNPFENKKLSELSDGNLQKTFIARALAQNSPFIILDEPTTNLDDENKLKILSLLRNLAKKENKLILFSSHDWRFAMEFSDKIWWLKEHHLTSGLTEEIILKNPKLLSQKSQDDNHLFFAPEIFAPQLEKEMMFSFLKKNFSQDLKKFKLTFQNDNWELKSGNFCNNYNTLTDIKKILQTLINIDLHN